MNTNDPGWQESVYQLFKQHNIRQVIYVPDAGHAPLIDRCLEDPQIKAGPLTNEFEGPGMCAGAWLGGERSVLLMQSSGVGNIINALGLVRHCTIPFLTLVTMRGEWGEFNPWQLHMGQSTTTTLEASGVVCNRADSAEDVAPVVESSINLAFHSYAQVAVIISQRVMGTKVFE